MGSRSPHSSFVRTGTESVGDVWTWDGTKSTLQTPSGGSGSPELKVFYFEDDGWANGDTAGDTNRTACRKTVKRAYDAIAAGLPHAVLSWKPASAGVGIVNFGTGVGGSGSTTAIVDSSILGSFTARAAIVLGSHMTLWVPSWFELTVPASYNGGTSGTHQRLITTTGLLTSSSPCADIHVIVDGCVNGRGGQYGSNADKVSLISLDSVEGTTVRSMYRRGEVKNWRGLNGSTLEAWGVVFKDCANAECFGIEAHDDELGDSRTGIAAQYTTGYHVHDVVVHDLTGQGISGYGSRDVDIHDHDVYSCGEKGVNLEYCDNVDVHDATEGRSIARVTAAANNPMRTNVNMSSTSITSLPSSTITVVDATKLKAASVAKPAKAVVYNDAGVPMIVSYTGKTSTTLTGCVTTGLTGNISTGVVVPWQGCDYGIFILMDSGGALNGTGAIKLRRLGARSNATAGIGIKNVWTGTAESGTSGTQLVPKVDRVTLASAATATVTGATITINGHSGTGNYTNGSKTVDITSAGTIVSGDSGTVTSSGAGISGTGVADVSYAQVSMYGAWVRVGGGSNPLVRIVSVTPGASFNTDVPHGGAINDTIYVIGATVDIDDCDLQENANGGIHLAMGGSTALVAQQHSIRVNPTTRFLDNTGGKDFRGANAAGTSTNWNASTVPLSISGGSVSQLPTPVVTLGEYVWNWSMCTIEYDFDFDTITAGTSTGLIKLRGGGIAGPTTNKGDLDRTIVNAAADFAKLPTRWTLRLQPGEGVIFLGGAQGLSAAPTIVSQRIWVS